MQAEVYDAPWLAMDLPFPCEIHPFTPHAPMQRERKKVLALFSEPKKGVVTDQWLAENYRHFDLIVTYDHRLAHLPNVRIMYYGSCWCDTPPRHKDFSVSFLLSTGGGAAHYDGYPVRREVAENFGWPSIPGRLFLSARHLAFRKEELEKMINAAESRNYAVGRPDPSPHEKGALFNSMFHISIENNVDDYYFTEKIMDCFRTYTVPIYWGTDKILELFDPDGIIHVKSAEEAHKVIGELTPDDYWRRLPALAHNYKTAEQYIDVTGRLRQLILENLS